ncbi:MAG: hypothetical protein AAFX87_20230 [Bacteroidota bacterium]
MKTLVFLTVSVFLLTINGCTNQKAEAEIKFDLTSIQNDQFKTLMEGLDTVQFSLYFHNEGDDTFGLDKPQKRIGNEFLQNFFSCIKNEDYSHFYDYTDYKEYPIEEGYEPDLFGYSLNFENFVILPLRKSDETDSFITLFSFNTKGELIDCLTVEGNRVDAHVIESSINDQGLIEVKHTFQGQWVQSENVFITGTITDIFELTEQGYFKRLKSERSVETSER